MTERLNSAAEVEARPDFDNAAPMTVEQLAALIGKYDFRENVRCQVVRDGHPPCGQKHRHGHLGRTKDGKEGYIGSCCARKYFKDSSTYVLEERRIKRSLELRQAQEQLRHLLQHRDQQIVAVNGSIASFRALQSTISSVKRALPRKAMEQLVQMAKAASGRVEIDRVYVERDEEGKTKTSHVTETLGYVKGLLIFKEHEYFRYLADLKNTLEALEVAEPDSSHEKQLRPWIKRLADFPKLVERIEKVQASLDQFRAPDNLNLLIFLFRSRQDQRSMAKAAREISGLPAAESDIVALIESEYRRIAATNQNRDFNGRF